MATTKKYAWFIERITEGAKRLAIVENTPKTEGGVTDNWSTISTDNLGILVDYIAIPTLITSATAASPSRLEERYFRGVLNKAIAEGYKDPRNMDLNNVLFFENEYEKTVKKAKKFSRAGVIRTGSIIPQDF